VRFIKLFISLRNKAMSFCIKKYFHFIPLSPLLPTTIALIIGILWQSTSLTTIQAIITSIAFCTLLTNLNIYKKLHTLIYVLMLFTGAYLYHQQITDADNFYLLTSNKSITITGIVTDKDQEKTDYSSSTVLTIETTKIDEQPINKKIIIHAQKSTDIIYVGDTVTFFNVFVKKPTAESFYLYQIKEKIAATIFDQNIKYTITNHPSWSFNRFLFELKQKVLNAIKQKTSSIVFIFFTSLFLGNRHHSKQSMEDVNENFKRWGIFHLLARSGMHLAFFVIAWQTSLQFIPMPFFVKQIFIMLLCLIYYLLSWSSTPFLRSLSLFFINKTCTLTNTIYHSLHYLTLICLCFLLYCPLYIFFLDFQLTFAITFAIVWFSQLQSLRLYQNNSN
jgi:hypothetical protein